MSIRWGWTQTDPHTNVIFSGILINVLISTRKRWAIIYYHESSNHKKFFFQVSPCTPRWFKKWTMPKMDDSLLTTNYENIVLILTERLTYHAGKHVGYIDRDRPGRHLGLNALKPRGRLITTRPKTKADPEGIFYAIYSVNLISVLRWAHLSLVFALIISQLSIDTCVTLKVLTSILSNLRSHVLSISQWEICQNGDEPDGETVSHIFIIKSCKNTPLKASTNWYCLLRMYSG